MTGMKRDLFCLCKEVIGVTIQHYLSNLANGNEFLRNYLGRIKNVKVEVRFLIFFYYLQAKFVFREVSILNHTPEVATVEVGVLAGNLRSEEQPSELQSRE